MGEESEGKTVRIDSSGRITLPEDIRTRLELGEGDRLAVDIENGEAVLRPTASSFEPITRDESDFGSEAFLDAGEALFGNPVDRNDDLPEERSTRTARLEHPSRFLYLTRHDSVPILIDALLDLPPGREVNKTEFAEHAGVTRQTVSTYIDLLLELDVVEEVPNTSPGRYRVADSDVVQKLFELNSALNAVEH